MGFIFKALVYLFFAAVVVPSSYNFYKGLDEHVLKGKTEFKDFAAETPKYSYLPVFKFYTDQYENFTSKKETENEVNKEAAK